MRRTHSIKKSLIFGISGQDGTYLAKHLLSQGQCVIGVSRGLSDQSYDFERVGITDFLAIEEAQPNNFGSVLSVVEKVQPDNIYYLCGPSSVARSFQHPLEAYNGLFVGLVNVLEAVRVSRSETRVFHASSGECFGETGMIAATEDTSFAPVSPYGAAKAAAHMAIRIYREKFGLFASNGILFNHESPIRSDQFVTKKIVSAIKNIQKGIQSELVLGNIKVVRDWGWAPEYVRAMNDILDADEPSDFIVATGKSHSLAEFVQIAFGEAGMDWREYLVLREDNRRPNELLESRACPDKIANKLGWSSEKTLPEIVKELTTIE